MLSMKVKLILYNITILIFADEFWPNSPPEKFGNSPHPSPLSVRNSCWRQKLEAGNSSMEPTWPPHLLKNPWNWEWDEIHIPYNDGLWVRWQGDTCQLYDLYNLWWLRICLCFSNFSLPYFTTPGPFSVWILYRPAQRKNERVRSCSADFFGASFERFSSSLPTSLNGVKQRNVNLPIQGLPFPPQKKPPRLHVFQLGPWLS